MTTKEALSLLKTIVGLIEDDCKIGSASVLKMAETRAYDLVETSNRLILLLGNERMKAEGQQSLFAV